MRFTPVSLIGAFAPDAARGGLLDSTGGAPVSLILCAIYPALVRGTCGQRTDAHGSTGTGVFTRYMHVITHVLCRRVQRRQNIIRIHDTRQVWLPVAAVGFRSGVLLCVAHATCVAASQRSIERVVVWHYC